ncbi:MAG: nucleotidyltransferase family protein [Bacteroidales bacterium]
MTRREDIISKLNELKPWLQQEYSVSEIGLFGSFADNTQTDESDIDILVELEKPIGWRFFSLELYLEKIFNQKIDLVTKKALKEQIREGILNNVTYV